jgi:hypothetical protein
VRGGYFYLATSGYLELATRGYFFMATDSAELGAPNERTDQSVSPRHIQPEASKEEQ